MKKLIVLLVVIVLLAAASPYVVGLRARSVVDDFASNLNSLGYETTMESYNVGYLESEGVLNVRVDPERFMQGDLTPEQRAEMEEMLAMFADGVSLQLDIKHGPLLEGERSTGLFSADIALTDDSAALEQFKQEFGIDELMTTRAAFGFGGDGEIVLHAPPFMVDSPEGESLAFGGFDYRVNLQDWGRTFDAQGEVHETTGTGFDSTVRIAPLVFTARGNLNDGAFVWTGEASFTTEGVFIAGADGGSMENLSIVLTSTSPTPDTLDMAYRLSIERITGGTMLYDLQDLVISASASGMSKAALLEMQQVFADPARAADPQATAAAIEGVMNGTEIRIDEVSLRYGPDVDLLLTGAYSFEDGFLSAVANAGAAPANPMQLLGMVNAQLSLDLSQGVIDQVIELVLRQQVGQMAPEATPEQIDQLIELQKLQMTTMIPGLVQGGMLRQAGRGYQADLQLEGGTLTINGVPVPIPGMQ